MHVTTKDYDSIGVFNIPDTTNEPIIEIDKYRLKQIFNNLISNALKFINEGFIEIGYSLYDYQIEFYIKDSGIGISEKNYQIIFERFRQVDNTNTRRFGGNGLGLAITKNLLEMLGGKIWVKSEEKKVSTFNFSLPFK
jgi:signal transduction histidine kinase